MAAVVYQYDKTVKATYLTFQSWITSIGSDDKSIIIAVDTEIIDTVTVPNNIDIAGFYNGAMFTGTGTLTINKMSCDPQHQIFANTLTSITVNNKKLRPVWFADNDINRAILALPASGGDILLEIARYSPVLFANMRSNLRIIGKMRPYFNADLTGLEGGSIIDGPFLADHDYVQLFDLGVDSGSAVCTSRYAGVYQEGIAIYNSTGSTSPTQKKGIIVNNASSICQSYTAPVHACLIEKVDGAIVNNVYTCFGTHGVVLKGTRSVLSNLFVKYHNSEGLILRNNDYAVCHNNTVSNVYIEGGAYGTGGVVINNNQGVTDNDLYNITITGLVCKSTTFGIYYLGHSDPSYMIRNIIVVGDVYDDCPLITDISGQVDLSTIFSMSNNLCGTKDFVGVKKPLEAFDEFYHDKDVGALNKAGTGWVKWAIRNSAGTEVQVDLQNIGYIDINGNINVRYNARILNNAGNDWLSFLTRTIYNSEATIDMANIGSLSMVSSAWDGPHFIMGAYHFWVDGSGRLRIKSGAPSSDTDGVVVGTQT